MNEETIIETVVTETPQQKKTENRQTESKNETTPSSQKQRKNGGETKKIIGASGLAAAAGVAAGLLIPVQVFPQSSEIGDEENLEDGMTHVHPVGEEMDVATSIDDSMTFNQAFAAARREVGPGGLFVWHGHTYGTYYAEEWNAMSEADKEQYWADVNATTSHLNESNGEDEEIANIEGVDLIADGEIPTEPEDGWDDEEGEVIEPLEALADVEILDGDSEIAPIDDGNGEVVLDDVPVNELDGSIDFATDDQLDGGSIENPDFDMLASNFTDSDIPIDNHMDMSDFA